MNNFCIPQILEDIYIQTQDKTAIVSNSGEISFKELYKQSICLSNILSNLGVKKGDTVIRIAMLATLFIMAMKLWFFE